MKFEHTLSFARKMDRLDPLRSFKNQFHNPRRNGKPLIYFTGNSLGLQPKSVKRLLNEELEDWAELAVDGHEQSRRPWLYYHKFSKKALANLTGAKAIEVVAMNQLTVNLHLMLISFFRPTPARYKIITEAGAFSSDQYAFESQLKFHGLNPETALIELKPREGESILRTEDILDAIRFHKNEIALVIFGGVQYYTGQFFDIRRITAAGHDAGAFVGFDLAHAIGNVPLTLHKDNVDFAIWCSYKYLNSGPGGLAGAFVHERFSGKEDIPRFAGWWGHNEKERFAMRKGFRPMSGVDGWQVSNHPILSSAAQLAALEIFEQAGIKNLRTKSIQLTGYLEFLLNEIDPTEKYFKILTPTNKDERGCQLSIFVIQNGKKFFQTLSRAGVVADWRDPGVIRLAPAPLYNTFEEVFTCSEVFRKFFV
jgi:kynureninase